MTLLMQLQSRQRRVSIPLAQHLRCNGCAATSHAPRKRSVSQRVHFQLKLARQALLLRLAKLSRRRHLRLHLHSLRRRERLQHGSRARARRARHDAQSGLLTDTAEAHSCDCKARMRVSLRVRVSRSIHGVTCRQRTLKLSPAQRGSHQAQQL